MNRVVHLSQNEEVEITLEEKTQLLQLYNIFKKDMKVFMGEVENKKALNSLTEKNLAKIENDFTTVTKKGRRVAERLK